MTTHSTSPFNLPLTMHAALYDRFGGPEVVRLPEVPVPRPGANEVLGSVLIKGFRAVVGCDSNS